jgi:hypothetical protein
MDINAFRILRRKPMLLLLLLPLHAAVPLAAKLLPAAGTSLSEYTITNFTDLMNYAIGLLPYFACLLGIVLLMYLAAGLLFVPPAMELLKDGADDLETPRGWYGRGMKKFWWKPAVLGTVEVAACGLLAVIFLVFIELIQFLGDPGLSYLNPFALLSPEGIAMIALASVLCAAVYCVLCLFALLLPAAANGSLDAAFGAVFSKKGLKKALKVLCVFLLADMVSMAVYYMFEFGYILLGGYRTSVDNLFDLMNLYASSWTAYCATVTASFVILFKYAYVFSVFREIRDEEKKFDIPEEPVILPAWEQNIEE